ncbi:hypothetical protein TNCV_730861 [Trichonephila clavipes]|nr:hypothetical protein TNCV_730861 [Trichonephila clavipes]
MFNGYYDSSTPEKSFDCEDSSIKRRYFWRKPAPVGVVWKLGEGVPGGPRPLTMAQNEEVHRHRVALECDANSVRFI